VRKHLASVDLEALAELDGGAVDKFSQHYFSFVERQLPQVAADWRHSNLYKPR
jgi:hypothetical protein